MNWNGSPGIRGKDSQEEDQGEQPKNKEAIIERFYRPEGDCPEAETQRGQDRQAHKCSCWMAMGKEVGPSWAASLCRDGG